MLPEIVSAKIFLGEAYPNPFSINTEKAKIKINYGIKQNEIGKLTIFNIKGQKIRSYYHLEGNSSIAWNARDDKGNSVSTGVYLYRLKTSSFERVHKLVITK